MLPRGVVVAIAVIMILRNVPRVLTGLRGGAPGSRVGLAIAIVNVALAVALGIMAWRWP